jgi:Tfp pilus assembly protein PilN
MTHAEPINLLPRGRVVAMKRRARIRAWCAASGGYGLCLVIACVLALTISVPDGSLRESISEKHVLIQSSEKELATLRQEAATVQRAIEAANAVGNHPDWRVLLQLLAHARGEQVVLERCDLKPRPADPKAKAGAVSDTGFLLTLDGVAQSQRAASQYVLDLEDLGVFETVTLIETRPYITVRPTSAGISLIGFRVHCTLSDGRAVSGVTGGGS